MQKHFNTLREKGLAAAEGGDGKMGDAAGRSAVQ
jgi:hypothetical protein